MESLERSDVTEGLDLPVNAENTHTYTRHNGTPCNSLIISLNYVTLLQTVIRISFSRF